MSSHREVLRAQARRRAKEKEDDARVRREEEEEEERVRREEEEEEERLRREEEEEEAFRRKENYIRMLSMYYKEVMNELPDMTESELKALVKGLPREWVLGYWKANGRRVSRRRPARTRSWWNGGKRTRKQRG